MSVTYANPPGLLCLGKDTGKEWNAETRDRGIWTDRDKAETIKPSVLSDPSLPVEATLYSV